MDTKTGRGNGRNQRRAVVGRVSFANREAFEYTDPAEFLKVIQEELPYHPTSGLRYKVLTDDPQVRKLKKLQERQTELLHLAFSAGADCVDYDEEIQKVNLEIMRLTEKRVEMSGQQGGDQELELKMEALSDALRHIPNRVSVFDEVTVRQLVSSIKVLDKERLLVCFQDGEEIISEKE